MTRLAQSDSLNLSQHRTKTSPGLRCFPQALELALTYEVAFPLPIFTRNPRSIFPRSALPSGTQEQKVGVPKRAPASSVLLSCHTVKYFGLPIKHNV